MSKQTKMVLRLSGSDAETRGLPATQLELARVIHQKPWLTAEVPVQVFVDLAGNYLPNPEEWPEEKKRWAMAVLEVPFRVDPKRLKREHSNRIQAIQTQIGNATGMTDRVMAMQAEGFQNRANRPKFTKNDLVDVAVLMELYDDLDDALDERLVDCVTEWDYADEDGELPKLDKKFLRDNVAVAEAMQVAFSNFLNRSQRPSPEATPTRVAENGLKETTSTTLEVSPVASPTGSSPTGKKSERAPAAA